MKTVVFGYHLMGCLGLEALLRHGFEVQALFTHRDPSSGEQVWWPSTARLGEARGVAVRYSDGPRTGDGSALDLVESVAGYRPEILFSFYYRDLLPAAVLDLAPRGGFNLHGSLLPDGRGRAPVNWSLVRGLTRTGVTLHRMVERADAGAIIDQEAVPIDDCDTAYSLYQKLATAAVSLLDRSLPALRDGTCQSRPMDLSKGTYFGRRKPEDGLLEWHRPARELYNLVRAVTHPYPGAFFDWAGRRVLVWWAQVVDEGPRASEPGKLVRVDSDGIEVATGRGRLRIITVQPAGEPEMPACTFAHLHGIVPGMSLDGEPCRHDVSESESPMIGRSQ